MKGMIVMILAIVFGLAVGGVSAKTPTDKEVPRITKEELKSMLGNPDVIILDVRLDDQWKVSERKIIGALHETPKDVTSWVGKYPKDKTIVLY